MSDEVEFLNAGKHESLLQIDTMILVEIFYGSPVLFDVTYYHHGNVVRNFASVAEALQFQLKNLTKLLLLL